MKHNGSDYNPDHFSFKRTMGKHEYVYDVETKTDWRFALISLAALFLWVVGVLVVWGLQ